MMTTVRSIADRLIRAPLAAAVAREFAARTYRRFAACLARSVEPDDGRLVRLQLHPAGNALAGQKVATGRAVIGGLGGQVGDDQQALAAASALDREYRRR